MCMLIFHHVTNNHILKTYHSGVQNTTFECLKFIIWMLKNHHATNNHMLKNHHVNPLAIFGYIMIFGLSLNFFCLNLEITIFLGLPERFYHIFQKKNLILSQYNIELKIYLIKC